MSDDPDTRLLKKPTKRSAAVEKEEALSSLIVVQYERLVREHGAEKARGAIERGVPFAEWANGRIYLNNLSTNSALRLAEGNVWQLLEHIKRQLREACKEVRLLPFIGTTRSGDGAIILVLEK